eukprot:Em0010g899a
MEGGGEVESASTASRHPGVIQSLFAGAVAGAVAKTVIAPLERTKISFQVDSKSFSFLKAFEYLVKRYKTEGLLSLWRGNSATMARIVPYAAIQFASYEQYKLLLRPSSSHEQVLSPPRRFVAGSLAGMTATICTYPLDLTRARMALMTRHMPHAFVHTFMSVLRAKGVKGLYRGVWPTLAGIIPYAGTSFFTFETLKKLHQDYCHTSPPPIARLVFGAIAGLFGQTVTYPMDIVRRRMQTEGMALPVAYEGIVGTLSYVYRTEGIRGLFKGVSMNWVKGPIVVSISFNVYDLVTHSLLQRKSHIS